MKKLKRFRKSIPRKCRIAMNLAAAAVLLMFIYICFGCPAFTLEQQFRREEKAYLVGPSEIITTIELTNNEFDRMIVADDGDGLITYCCDVPSYRWDSGLFVYREKAEGMNLLAMPSYHFGTFDAYLDLPIVLLHDEPKAARAELELTLGKGFDIQETVTDASGTVIRQDFEKTYCLESETAGTGFFIFMLHAGTDSGQMLEDTTEGFVLKRFARMFAESGMYLYEYVPATVRLYDRAGNLITEETITVRSRAGQRYFNEQQ